jgi:hypothetical protein
MTTRTKIWLIAVSVGVTVGAASWGRMYFTRARIVADAQTSYEELAHDIAEDLRSVEADAGDREFEEKLLGYGTCCSTTSTSRPARSGSRSA